MTNEIGKTNLPAKFKILNRHKRHGAVRDAVIELVKTHGGNTIGMTWPTACYFATTPNGQNSTITPDLLIVLEEPSGQTQTVAIDFSIFNQSATTTLI